MNMEKTPPFIEKLNMRKVVKEPLGYKERILLHASERFENYIMRMENLSDKTKKYLLSEMNERLEDPVFIKDMVPKWEEDFNKSKNLDETEERLINEFFIKKLKNEFKEYIDKKKAA